jgi:Icc-related predicted phosphoesterase
MRIYYAGDIHGSERCWRKFLNAADFYEADVLILGGDVTGKVMVPLVETGSERWVARMQGIEEVARNEEDLGKIEKRARMNGFYPYRCSGEEYQRLDADAEFRETVMSQVMNQELERWMEIADEKLSGTGVRCLVMPGNDDEFEIDSVLGSAGTVENPEGKVVDVDGYQMISCAWASPTPWDSPRELPEDQLEDKIDALARQIDPDAPAIFNLHCPPFDSGLDSAPSLTSDLRVITKGGEQVLEPVGSRAVRSVIERHQPILGLHGHIHESRHAATIGRTLCLNPGSIYSEGVIDGALIDLDGAEVVRHQFVQG